MSNFKFRKKSILMRFLIFLSIYHQKKRIKLMNHAKKFLSMTHQNQIYLKPDVPK